MAAFSGGTVTASDGTVSPAHQAIDNRLSAYAGIKLAAGIRPEDVTYRRLANGLEIGLADGSTMMPIQHQMDHVLYN